MTEILNWDKLTIYNSTQNKSFEELCFQLCLEEYNLTGNFVRIDDSGGGDGVEYYLELPNGDILGWQCKFFGRFNEGGRQEQIKKSLHTAYKKHGSKLKKWILCSKNSLTNEEKKWFDSIRTLNHKGNAVLPEDATLELEHWGDSILLNLLRKYPSIHKFFFTEKILDDNWFQKKFELIYDSNVIKTKYLDNLHTKGEVDDFVTKHIGGIELISLIEKTENNIDIYNFQIGYNRDIERIKRFENENEFCDIYSEIRDFILINQHDKILNDGVILIQEIKDYFTGDNYKLSEMLEIKIENYITRFRSFYHQYIQYRNADKLREVHWDDEELEIDNYKKNKIKDCRETLLGPYFTIRNYDYFLELFEQLNSLNNNVIHICGNASKGKTHISVNIIKKQISKNKPALFIFGKNLKSNLPLREQLRSILDIPLDWSFSDFLEVLNISGRINNTKAIFLIDGLNEAIYWKTIWGDNLEELINEIDSKFPNILFITTFRTSYKEQLFPSEYFHYNNENYDKLIEIHGFNRENINEAIKKYFSHYNITLEHSSNAINAFIEPLYLKIFCETKQGQLVTFQNEDLFDVFEEYLIKTNNSIIEKLGLELRFNKKHAINILEKISKLLWENSSRDIDFEYLIENILSQDELLVFEKEDLLIFRDWNNVEVVTFTYDLLSGYLIAKTLFNSINSEESLKSIINSEKFKRELLTKETYHPLFNDILRCFCVLAIKKFGIKFYNYGMSKIFDEYILNSIFELNRNIILKNKNEIIQIIQENFKNNATHNQMYSLFKNTDLDCQNPLNMNLLSDILFNMSVSDRDLSWTEYIRFNNGKYDNDYKKFLIGFEDTCKDKKSFKSDKIHLAAIKTMWFLSSTNREFRDLSTRALYFYGRKYPNEFIELIEYSLSINDPYIWERTLAALYGVVMAENNIDENFKNEVLPKIALKLFDLMFRKNALFSTTHILARDYASKCLQTCLLHHPKLFNKSDIKLTKSPFKYGGNRNPDEFDYSKDEGIFSEPISMDFSNYTIGRIVKDGHSYSDPPDKKKVRSQIYARIFDLGWNEKQFNEIDGRIRSDSYFSRTEQAHVERYGKKYSWIAYFEIAGLRSDKKLIENYWDEFRFSDADIDPSFPLKPENKKFVIKDYLGDRNLSLIEWYKSGERPDVNEYLKINNLNGNNGYWVCLDGFIVQENKEINREVFFFIRGLLIKSDDYNDVKNHLESKDFGGRFLPDPSSNHHTFAGELYSLNNSTEKNICGLSFEKNRKKIKVKKGDPGYYPKFSFSENKIQQSFPDFIEIEDIISDDYEILLPVMDYSWENSHSVLNQAGHETVISNDLVNHLNLRNKAQTFDLFDESMSLASQNIYFHEEFNDNHRFVYLRKDLLDKYLLDNNYKLIWGIWGERNVRFEGFNLSREFHEKHKISDFQIFSEIIDYK